MFRFADPSPELQTFIDQICMEPAKVQPVPKNKESSSCTVTPPSPAITATPTSTPVSSSSSLSREEKKGTKRMMESLYDESALVVYKDGKKTPKDLFKILLVGPISQVEMKSSLFGFFTSSVKTECRFDQNFWTCFSSNQRLKAHLAAILQMIFRYRDTFEKMQTSESEDVLLIMEYLHICYSRICLLEAESKILKKLSRQPCETDNWATIIKNSTANPNDYKQEVYEVFEWLNAIFAELMLLQSDGFEQFETILESVPKRVTTEKAVDDEEEEMNNSSEESLD